MRRILAAVPAVVAIAMLALPALALPVGNATAAGAPKPLPPYSLPGSHIPAASAEAHSAAASDPGVVSYLGGPVMGSGVTVHTIYWDPNGRFSSQVPGFSDQVDGFVRDVANDSGSTSTVFSVPTEYYGPDGRHIRDQWHFGGRVDDTDPYPTFGGTCAVGPGVPCVTTAQIQAELSSLIARRHLPTGTGQFYSILLPPGVIQCEHFANDFTYVYNGVTYHYNDCTFNETINPNGYYCALHDNVLHSAPQGPPTPDQAIVYAVMPYANPTGSCGLIGPYPTAVGAEAVINSLTHEAIEAQTDPLPFENAVGWVTDQYLEVGDLCELNVGSIIGSTAIGPYNQIINGHPYLVQSIWSNRAAGCATRAAARHSSASVTAVTAVTAARTVPAGVSMSRAYFALPSAVQTKIAESLAWRPAAAAAVSLPGVSAIVTHPGVVLAAPGASESDTSPRIGYWDYPSESSAIGLAGLLEATNHGVALYDRAMHRTSIASDYELAGVPIDDYSPAFNPTVSWDPVSGRFEYAIVLGTGDQNPADVVQRAADPNLLLYGFSRSATPTNLGASQWCTYAANTDHLGSGGADGILFGTPRLGHYDGHMVIAGQLLDETTRRYVGTSIATAPTPPAGPLFTGCPAAPATFTGSASSPLRTFDGTAAGLVDPVTATGSMPDGYAVAAENPYLTGVPTAHHVYVWKITASGAVVAQPDITVPSYGIPENAPQPGSPNLIDTYDASFGQAVAHTWPGGQVSIFVAHATSVTAGSAPTVQWFELQPGTATPLQTGTIADASESLFDASIAPDTSGRNLTLTYNEAGSTLARVVVATHLAGAPAGAVGPPVTIATSSAPAQDETCDPADGIGCEWGPFSSASTDPLGHAVWITNEYSGPPDPNTSGSIGWRTANAQVIVPS